MPEPPPALPDCLIVELQSILNPLDLASLFQVDQPVEVELGCGDASFLIHYAGRHPEHNFLGVERLLGRIRKIDRKGRRLGLSNLRGVRIEARYFLEYLLPESSVCALHVYFPDPWPKAKHARRRLVDAAFPAQAARVLPPDGRVYLRTDDEPYFAQMREVFGASAAFAEAEIPPELTGVETDFEHAFRVAGKAIWAAAYARRSPAGGG